MNELGFETCEEVCSPNGNIKAYYQCPTVCQPDCGGCYIVGNAGMGTKYR